MEPQPSRSRDDQVLGPTRALATFITPFLVVGGVGLYLFPGSTERWWAWPIHPTMTAMVLASAYLGGAWFFVRVHRERRWSAVHGGFVPVTAFATLLGVATFVHWDRFTHDHPAFWVWTGLYVLAPPLVLAAWLANRRRAAPTGPDDVVLGRLPQAVVAVVGGAATLQGAVMVLSPASVIPVWPWPLTPLTCRVVGAVLCLGCAGLGVLGDPRWLALRLLVQVEVVMVALMLLAGLRAHAELDAGRPLTWVLLAGFAGLLAGSAWLWWAYERGGGRVTPKPATASRSST